MSVGETCKHRLLDDSTRLAGIRVATGSKVLELERSIFTRLFLKIKVPVVQG